MSEARAVVVESITVVIGKRRIKISPDEAVRLRDALDTALGKPSLVPAYPPPTVWPDQQSWPYRSPQQPTTGDPAPWMPFTSCADVYEVDTFTGKVFRT